MPEDEGLSLWDAFDEHCGHVWQRPEGLGSHDRSNPPFCTMVQLRHCISGTTLRQLIGIGENVGREYFPAFFWGDTTAHAELWDLLFVESTDLQAEFPSSGIFGAYMGVALRSKDFSKIVSVQEAIDVLYKLADAGNMRWGGRVGSSASPFQEIPAAALSRFVVRDTVSLDQILFEWDTGQTIYDPRFLFVDAFTDSDRKVASDRAEKWLIEAMNDADPPGKNPYGSKEKVYAHLKSLPKFDALEESGIRRHGFLDVAWPNAQKAVPEARRWGRNKSKIGGT
jgi:hypothetical protein